MSFCAAYYLLDMTVTVSICINYCIITHVCYLTCSKTICCTVKVTKQLFKISVLKC